MALAERVRLPKMLADRALSRSNRALYQCSGCRHQVSLTAGTILASTKLPLRTWFLVMYLVTQTKNGISALELSRQLAVSYNTAWKVKHKLMQAMKERDDTRPLGGWVQLDDAYWGGERRGGKRGRGAPGKTPFVATVELNREGRPVRMRLSRVGAFHSDELAAWAKCQLEPGTLVFSDALGCFSAVQRRRCFHQPFVTGGDRTARTIRHCSGSIRFWATSSVRCVAAYHHVSSKHLPRYLAEFSYLITHDSHPVRLLPEKRHVGHEPTEKSARKCRQTLDRTPRLQGQTVMFPQHELRT